MTSDPSDASLRPQLRRQGHASQLFVDGRPMILTAGEMENSSGTSREWMAPLWGRCAQANLNTVLAAVPWDLFEPEEGRFDFEVIDGLIEDARAHGMKLVPLWFGLWKNGLSHYAPLWVKRDQKRFARTRIGEGNLEMISTFSEAALEAGKRAFAMLMRRIGEMDAGRHTVVMVQLENEVGINGDFRDRSVDAEKAFAGQVPEALTRYLAENEHRLLPETLALWPSRLRSGSWAEVFGDTVDGGHVFMAWSYARFLNEMAAAGKAEYDIPIYVNAALPKLPGHARLHGPQAWGGPIPAVMDIWQAGAPAIDMLSPDIYRPDFETVIAEFNRAGNPIFVPEALPEMAGAANAFYTVGQGGIGYSPFGIDARVADYANGPLTQAYGLLNQIAPIVLEHQAAGSIASARVHPDQTRQVLDFGGYEWTFERVTYWRTPLNPIRDWGYCIIMQTGPEDFLIAGFGMQISLAKPGEAGTIVGLGSVDEVALKDGQWVRRRRLSGDQIMGSYSPRELNRINQSGTLIKFWDPEPITLKVTLYSYQK